MGPEAEKGPLWEGLMQMSCRKSPHIHQQTAEGEARMPAEKGPQASESILGPPSQLLVTL